MSSSDAVGLVWSVLQHNHYFPSPAVAPGLSVLSSMASLSVSGAGGPSTTAASSSSSSSSTVHRSASTGFLPQIRHASPAVHATDDPQLEACTVVGPLPRSSAVDDAAASAALVRLACPVAPLSLPAVQSLCRRRRRRRTVRRSTRKSPLLMPLVPACVCSRVCDVRCDGVLVAARLAWAVARRYRWTSAPVSSTRGSESVVSSDSDCSPLWRPRSLSLRRDHDGPKSSAGAATTTSPRWSSCFRRRERCPWRQCSALQKYVNSTLDYFTVSRCGARRSTPAVPA
jgi:hypothetical protein